ncbi:MAG: hypothetical protein JSW39_23610 [Desulfobacterales bacterium]|nr:MAG: hypothetical protein JSW39_23610 [Desulfobacterales bacterium]
MKLKDGQKYAQKHGPEAQLVPAIEEAILKQAQNGELPCAVAFKIANDLKVAPVEVGKAVDLLEFKLTKCQLGLFGYKPQKKIVKAQAPESSELEEALRRTQADGKLSCQSMWEIADQFNLSKMTVSAACEALKLKIKPCQLGAF